MLWFEISINLNFKTSLGNCEELDADIFCEECIENFCQDCFNVLHKSKKKQNHNKSKVKDISLLVCKKHSNKKFELFCLEDETKLCSICVTEDHSKHEIFTIEKAIEILKNQI